MTSRRRKWTVVSLGLLLSFPLSASANAGVPMLMLAWPAYVMGLIPIVALESYIGRKQLGLSWRNALSVSTVGNLWSTFLGIPLTWLAMLAVEAVVGISLGSINAPASVQMLFFPFLVAWVPGFDSIWLFYAAFVVLSIPFCVASIWIERIVALKRLPTYDPVAVRTWIKHANLWSYGVLVTVTAIFPAMRGDAT